MDLFLESGATIDQYKLGEEIGHGAFSEVYEAVDSATNETFALKCMHLTCDGQLPLPTQREIAALQQLHHQHIIRLQNIVSKKFSTILVLDRCSKDLLSILKAQKGTPIPPGATKTIIHQVLSALAYCHSSGFVHRDVSPSNILFTSTGSIKLADFGQARLIPDTHTTKQSNNDTGMNESLPLTPTVGTRWYKAPELLFGSRSYTNSIDIWSVGCILAELFTGAALFPGNSDIDQVCRIFGKLGRLDEATWPGVAQLPDWGKLMFPAKDALPWDELLPGVTEAGRDLVAGMLRYDPDKRLTAQQALEHAYFKEAPEQCGAEEMMNIFGIDNK